MRKFSIALFLVSMVASGFYGFFAFMPVADLVNMFASFMDFARLTDLITWAFPMFLLSVQFMLVGFFGMISKYGLLD